MFVKKNIVCIGLVISITVLNGCFKSTNSTQEHSSASSVSNSEKQNGDKSTANTDKKLTENNKIEDIVKSTQITEANGGNQTIKSDKNDQSDSNINQKTQPNSAEIEDSKKSTPSNNEDNGISQPEALKILQTILEKDQIPYKINFDSEEIKGGRQYYIYRLYDDMGTVAWFYVDKLNGKVFILDIYTNHLIEYISGKTKIY